MSKARFTEKQQRFILAYDGNATEAARKAGYDGNDVTLGAVGYENLKNPQIKAAIDERMDEIKRKIIGSKLDRQKWLKSITDDESLKLADRLKAAEMLHKTEGDFLQKIEHQLGKETLASILEQTGSNEKEE